MDRSIGESLTLDGLASEPAPRHEAWDAPEQDRDWGAVPDGLRSQLLREPGSVHDDRSRWLASTIEAEIIPRLMLAHCAPQEGPDECKHTQTSPGAADVDELAKIAIDIDPAAAAAYVATLRDEGMALDVIYMELLAPAARRLGLLWEADLCDFAQVTLGLWRIQQVMYDLSPAFHSAGSEGMRGRKALLTPAPDSQHTFGLLMVSEFFRRAGWEVWARTAVSAREIVKTAREEWFDVCGISVGSECHIDRVASVIAEVRAGSRNPAIAIMVGGSILDAHPDLVSAVGADATARDAARAVERAEQLMKLRERLC